MSVYAGQSRARIQSVRESNQSTNNAQFALAGLSESEEDPRLSLKQFPHRGLESLDRERQRKSESDNIQQKSRLREDDRKGHLDTLLRATEQFLARGDITKAAKAFGIILQLRPRTQPIDIRLHNLWSIGAEILMRQNEELRETNQRLTELSAQSSGSVGGNSDGVQMTASRWDSSSGMSEFRSYFEILIRQYAYDHKLPHKISAIDFWLVLLSYELKNIYMGHLGAIARAEGEVKLRRTGPIQQDVTMPRSPSRSNSVGRLPDFEVTDSESQRDSEEHWLKKRKEEIRQRTLTELRDINQRMEKLMDQLPYSKDRNFLQLKEVMSSLSIDLSSSSF